MTSKHKVILLGIDRLDWNVVQIFVDKGLLPTFQKLIIQGASGAVLGNATQYSSAVWTTVLTGVEPTLHGVLHDLEYGPGGLSARTLSASKLRVPRIWDYAGLAGLNSHLIGWPALLKVSSMRGISVSNGIQHLDAAAIDVWPLSPDAVYPTSWRDNVLDYRVFPDDIPQHYLDELLQYLPPEQRENLQIPCRLLFSQLLSLHSVGMRLAETDASDWQLLALRFDTFSQISDLPLQLSFAGNPLSYLLGWYQFLDNMLAQYLSYLSDSDYLMLVSDQGINPALIGRPTGLATPSGAGMLCMKGPQIEADQLLEGVSALDIAPTLLAMMGLTPHANFSGKTLFRPLDALSPTVFAHEWPQPISLADLQPDMQDVESCNQRLKAMGVSPVDLSSLEQITGMLHAELLFVFAQSMYQQGQHQRCVEAARLSLQLRPDIIPVIVLLCRALLALQHVEACREVIDQYHAVDIGPVWRDVVDGMYAFGAGDWGAASAAFERLTAYGDGPVNAPLWWAESLIRLGNLHDAKIKLEQATQWSMEQVEAWSRLAYVCRMQQLNEQSLRAIQTAISMQPSNAALLLFRFELLAVMGHLSAAKADLLRAIKLAPGVISEKQANAVLLSAYHQHGQGQSFELVKF